MWSVCTLSTDVTSCSAVTCKEVFLSVVLVRVRVHSELWSVSEVKWDLLTDRSDVSSSHAAWTSSGTGRLLSLRASTRSLGLEVFMPKHTSFLLKEGWKGWGSWGRKRGEEGWKPKTKHSMIACKQFHVSGGVIAPWSSSPLPSLSFSLSLCALIQNCNCIPSVAWEFVHGDVCGVPCHVKHISVL